MNDSAHTASFTRFWQLEYSLGGGPATRALSQRLGALIAWAGFRAGVGPTQLTLLGAIINVTASALYLFLAPGWVSALTCLLLYQIAYGIDCADGQLARATQRSSEFGAWLDISSDCVSVIVLSFVLVLWLAGQEMSLLIACTVMALLTIGRVLSLYSSKAVGRSAHAKANQRQRIGGMPKRGLWLLIDTPVFYLMICLLRDLPTWLLAFAIFIGISHILQAGYLGMRLQAVRNST